MSSEHVKELYTEANELMHVVGEEMNRPEEDAIAHLVCHNSRLSINKYLSGFLMQRGITPVTPVTLASLLEQCQGIDERFKNLDFSGIHCQFDANPDEHYCLEMDKVGGCYQVARQVRGLIEN